MALCPPDTCHLLVCLNDAGGAGGSQSAAQAPPTHSDLLTSGPDRSAEFFPPAQGTLPPTSQPLPGPLLEEGEGEGAAQQEEKQKQPRGPSGSRPGWKLPSKARPSHLPKEENVTRGQSPQGEYWRPSGQAAAAGGLGSEGCIRVSGLQGKPSAELMESGKRSIIDERQLCSVFISVVP